MTDTELNYLTGGELLQILKTKIYNNFLSVIILLVDHLLSNWNHILEVINQWYELQRSDTSLSNIPAGSRT